MTGPNNTKIATIREAKTFLFPILEMIQKKQKPQSKAEHQRQREEAAENKIVFTTGAANKGSGTADCTKTRGTNKTDPGQQDHT